MQSAQRALLPDSYAHLTAVAPACASRFGSDFSTSGLVRRLAEAALRVAAPSGAHSPRLPGGWEVTCQELRWDTGGDEDTEGQPDPIKRALFKASRLRL